MKNLKQIRADLYAWQAKNPIVCYYGGVPLNKFEKHDLIVLVSKLMNDLLSDNEN